ncbi:MAG: hypothetical protein ACOX69_04455 [Coriobacteriales bacterium]|jgi:hypothetical protein
MNSIRHPKKRAQRRYLGVLCALLCICALLMLCSCRTTDFFTEVVISPFAQTVDTNNSDQTVVNSQDATKTSDDLSSLSWNKKAKKSKQTENLVTYSKKPTTTLNAHHSVYDTDPRFSGIKASDPVQLQFGSNSSLKKKKGTTTSSSNSEQQTKSKGTKAKNASKNTNASGASDSGENKSKSNAKGSGSGSSGKKGGGYKGKVTVYDPNNALADPPKADKVAAIGQAAVLVQAIGGRGSLCAMDRKTYSGTLSKGAVSFAKVFSDELSSDFSSKALIWKKDGTTPSTLSSAQALVKACGKGGVVIYDEDVVDPNGSWFTKAQRKVFEAAKLTFVPVSFKTVRSMKDAAIAVGKVLSETSTANNYCDALDEVMSTAKAAQKGSSGNVYTAIATDFVTGLHYRGRMLTTEDGLLFTQIDDEKLLSTMCSNVGVTLKTEGESSSSTSTYDVLWGMRYGASYKASLFSKNTYTSSCKEDIQLNDPTSTTSGSTWPGRGLGSKGFPYLVVSASGSLTSAQVKSRVVSEINSYEDSGTITPYSALPSNVVGSEPNRAVSTIGSSGDDDDNLFYEHSGVAAKSVRANPAGLLGSWNEGSVESVLETLWLARIYSAAPNDAGYEPVCNLSKSDFESAVLKFYKTVYRYDASSVLGKVVTDEGIG